jgi:uncharacterized membrane protein YsdA (DUF1294 family)
MSSLPAPLLLIAGAVLAAWNVATWAVYRIDKARARAGRGDRRISERALLGMAAAGGSIGALIAVYAHRQRHKAKKLGFAVRLWAIVVVHIVAVALLAHELMS